MAEEFEDEARCAWCGQIATPTGLCVGCEYDRQQEAIDRGEWDPPARRE